MDKETKKANTPLFECKDTYRLDELLQMSGYSWPYNDVKAEKLIKWIGDAQERKRLKTIGLARIEGYPENWSTMNPSQRGHFLRYDRVVSTFSYYELMEWLKEEGRPDDCENLFKVLTFLQKNHITDVNQHKEVLKNKAKPGDLHPNERKSAYNIVGALLFLIQEKQEQYNELHKSLRGRNSSQIVHPERSAKEEDEDLLRLANKINPEQISKQIRQKFQLPNAEDNEPENGIRGLGRDKLPQLLKEALTVFKNSLSERQTQ